MIHFVKNIPINENVPENCKEIVFGAGCFWGVERKFWDLPGVFLTSVGYSGGDQKIPHMKMCVTEIQIMQRL